MWWMPWRSQAMKDVAACVKPRGAGKRALIRGCPNGETRPARARDLEIVVRRRGAGRRATRTAKGMCTPRQASTKLTVGRPRLGRIGFSLEGEEGDSLKTGNRGNSFGSGSVRAGRMRCRIQ